MSKKKTIISADLSLCGNIDVLRELISQPLEVRWYEQKKDFYLCWLVSQWQYWCSSWNDLSTAWIRMMWAKKKTSISADLLLSGNIDVLRGMISQPLEFRWCERKKTSISADLSPLSGNIDVLREMISQPLELSWCEQKKRLLSLLTCHSVAILMFFVKWSLNRLN